MRLTCTVRNSTTLQPTQFDVEVPLDRVVQVHQGLDMSPARFSPQRGENCLIRKSLRDAETMAQLLFTPAPAVFSGQVCGERLDNLLAVFRPLALQDFAMNASTDLPVEQGRLGIDGHRRPLAGAVDQLADVGWQPYSGLRYYYAFQLRHLRELLDS